VLFNLLLMLALDPKDPKLEKVDKLELQLLSANRQILVAQKEIADLKLQTIQAAWNAKIAEICDKAKIPACVIKDDETIVAPEQPKEKK